jgi:hypothetical protein
MIISLPTLHTISLGEKQLVDETHAKRNLLDVTNASFVSNLSKKVLLKIKPKKHLTIRSPPIPIKGALQNLKIIN